MIVALFVLVGAVVAGLYAVLSAIRLLQIRRQRATPRPTDAAAQDSASDVPMYRFKGEVFEDVWQGSRGYERPDAPNIDENWTTRLIPAVFAPLRPSRFSDPSYWTRYLPGVAITWALVFLVLPLLVGALVQPSTGSSATFTPTAAQRVVPAHGVYVSQPRNCSGANAADASSDPAVGITDNDDGVVFSVRPGGRVTVTYLYGRPVFSPMSPLCPDTALDTVGHANYVAANSGSGFVYIPQPNGTVVAEIQVTAPHSVPLLLVVFALVLFVLDIVLTIGMKRSMRDLS
jgi:hypothetical protein